MTGQVGKYPQCNSSVYAGQQVVPVGYCAAQHLQHLPSPDQKKHRFLQLRAFLLPSLPFAVLPVLLLLLSSCFAGHNTSMFNIVLVEPEIPPNTGNIIRLCANTGTRLHLIEPLGFPLDDARMRRAGLDYHEYASLHVYRNWPTFLADAAPASPRMFALTTQGTTCFFEQSYSREDWFIFGPETRGLAPDLLNQFSVRQRLRLPMQKNSRSLNLSNTAAIVVFEAWRQQGFDGGS